MATGLRFITRIQDAEDYADAHTWAGLQTFSNSVEIGSFGGTARILSVTDKISVQYAGSNDYATIEGPINRTLRFQLMDDADGDMFTFRNFSGTDLLTIERTGKVGLNGKMGINETDPESPLHITQAGSDIIGTNTLLRFQAGDGQYFAWQYNADSSFLRLARYYSGAWSDLMSFDRVNGRVGIGTMSPQSKCSIYGHLRLISYSPSFPTSGSGIEMYYSSDTGLAYIESRDRTAATLKPLRLRASEHRITDGDVGIGTVAPTEVLDVEVGTNESFRISTGSATFGFPTGATSPTHGFGLTRTGDGNLTNIIFAEGTEGQSLGIKARHDISFYGDHTRNVTFLENGRAGFGITAPIAMLHVDQKSTTAAIPVLLLDQADVSEEMIEFESTIGVGNAIEAKGTKALTTTHFLKVTLPGALTRYIPCGTIA
jgi:hypothetical protein